MKALARSHFWWPGLDKEVEGVARECSACQAVKSAPAKAPLHPWAWPTAPWQRVHIDFAGPFAGRMFLVLVDAHSKWPEVCIMSSTTATKTISVLREIFARYGLPQQLVSDNGPQFSAERMVQTMKQSLKTGMAQGVPLEQSLMKFLIQYRVTPHAITGASPSSLFLGRNIRTRLDLLHSTVASRVQNKQLIQKDAVDRHRRAREFSIGQQIMAQNFQSGLRWIPGVVIDCKGPLLYVVQIQGGKCGSAMWIIYVNFILLEQLFQDIILHKELTKMIGHQCLIRIPQMKAKRAIQKIVRYKKNQLKCRVHQLGLLPTVHLS